VAVVVVVDLSTLVTKRDIMDKKLILQNHDPEQCFFCGEIDAEELIDCVLVGSKGLSRG